MNPQERRATNRRVSSIHLSFPGGAKKSRSRGWRTSSSARHDPPGWWFFLNNIRGEIILRLSNPYITSHTRHQLPLDRAQPHTASFQNKQQTFVFFHLRRIVFLFFFTSFYPRVQWPPAGVLTHTHTQIVFSQRTFLYILLLCWWSHHWWHAHTHTRNKIVKKPSHTHTQRHDNNNYIDIDQTLFSCCVCVFLIR